MLLSQIGSNLFLEQFAVQLYKMFVLTWPTASGKFTAKGICLYTESYLNTLRGESV